jgi:N-acetylgalactosamine kinase
MRAPRYSIILAAGKGTRMQSSTVHKVCFPVDGRPAILRALDAYNACGITHHIIVVGAMAAQVMDTVAQEYDNVLYAYQARQLGTADAARRGAAVLTALADETDVLVVAGDRIIEPVVLEQLFDTFYGHSCDLAFLSLPRRRARDLGRVLLSADGSVLGNLEVRDIRQRQIYAEIRGALESGGVPVRETLLSRIRRSFADDKASVAFGSLWDLLTSDGTPAGSCALDAEQLLSLVPAELTRFELTDPEGNRLALSPEEAEQAPLFNTSVYLVSSRALRYALDRLNRENAQHEEYLSDMITLLAQAREDGRGLFRVRTLRVDDDEAVMAFNNPAELLEVDAVMQARRRGGRLSPVPEGPGFRSLADWRSDFRELSEGRERSQGTDSAVAEAAEAASTARPAVSGGLARELASVYGAEPELLQERIDACLSLLERAAEWIGPGGRVYLVRSPGRVNMMGRHIDHQGGNCNLMTIGYETLMAVRPREDDRIRLRNLDSERFPDAEFGIGELVAELPWDDWLSLVNSQAVANLCMKAGGDWSQYVKASVLRLQKKFAAQKLRGFDMMVSGNIPIAAGLSSSSALVVGTAESLVALNGLATFPAQFVDLCGEGEWFVGTRGGSADHAAIKYGQRGKVVKVRFFDFGVEEIVPFPEGYSLLVCDSGVKANKTTNARDQFNHRVACYRLGAALIRRLFPQYAPLVHHLRDVNVRTLGVPLAWIYKILLHLPEKATREELREMLGAGVVDPLFESHRSPEDGQYPIRGVVLFGLAECERGRRFAAALRDRRLHEIGRLMNTSHDGDRVVRHVEGDVRPYRSPTDNAYLLRLIEDLESGDPARVVEAQLEWQPGSYQCSISDIDRMVDIALSVDGVVGAQLAGAGLGGCMMVLARNAAIGPLSEALERGYFRPAARLPSILRCTPISGSSVLLEPGERP